MTTIINRNYDANDLLHTASNPVNVDVMTDSSSPDTVTLTFTRSNTSDTSCQICQYKFNKADISQLYAYLGDALSWLDWEDSNSGGNGDDNTNPPKPVDPGNNGCDSNPACTSCIDGNIPTPPLGPYDPDFWPTLR